MERPPRRAGPSWLLNPRRLEIVLTAAAYPGIHLRSASRLLLSPLPSLRFHVRRLQENGLVSSLRSCGRVHLFISDMYPAWAENLLASWEEPTDRAVLTYVRGHPGIRRSAVDRVLRIRRAPLHQAIQRLVSRRVIRASTSAEDPRLRVTSAWDRLQELCATDAEKRLRRFLAILDLQGLSPVAQPIDRERVRISVDGPRARLRFVLPLNPLRRD